MNKLEKFFAFVGICVGGLLTWYAYHSNSHPQAPKLSEFAYLLLFPPSIALMGTERASAIGQVLIVAATVLANGGFYAFIAAILRALLSRERPVRPSDTKPE